MGPGGDRAGPAVSRFLDWLLGFLPDVDLPSLPPLPDVHLPVPTLSDIHLPVPGLSFPAVPVPDWVLFLLEYSKVWVPIVIAVVVALLAVRKHRTSEQKKRQWQAAPAPGEPAHLPDAREGGSRREQAGARER